MHQAEAVISEMQCAYLSRMQALWRGHEREFLIELVRSLDETAFAFTMSSNRSQLLRRDTARHLMLLGAASGLRPFIEALRDLPGGVPWGPTSSKRSDVADQHLINCGQLAALRRIAALERYGLVKATFRRKDHLILEATSDDDDVAERDAEVWFSDLARRRFAGIEDRLAAMKSEVATRIDSYAGVVDGWSLRYDPDWEMIRYHHDYAAIWAAGIAEADALPQAALLGGRAFADWNELSVTALGRLFHHIACATRLKSTTPGLELRNLLTVFARKDDICAVWQETGESVAWSQRILSALCLDAEAVAKCERDYEIPLPYYIDFGRDFVLLPMFGGLMNACAGLVWHLRRAYRPDWDRAVEGRESVFRNDLRALFPPPQYIIPDRSITLRRPDGTTLTDVDAIILEQKTGCLALVQLKWQDIYGRSLSERNSRRMNLLQANEWVERISEWVGHRCSKEIALTIGLQAAPVPPMLIVIARHAARFAGESGYDPRAHWVSWPILVQARTKFPLSDIRELLAACSQVRPTTRRRRRKGGQRYRLPGLTVQVYSS
jgi:hypothetical protein